MRMARRLTAQVVLVVPILLVAGCRSARGPASPCACAPTSPAPPPAEPRLVLERVGFRDLPGWADDAVGEAIPAFLRSCAKLSTSGDGERVGRSGVGGLA